MLAVYVYGWAIRHHFKALIYGKTLMRIVIVGDQAMERPEEPGRTPPTGLSHRRLKRFFSGGHPYNSARGFQAARGGNRSYWIGSR